MRYLISVMSYKGKNFLHISSNNDLSMASKADDIVMSVTVRFFLFCIQLLVSLRKQPKPKS